MIYSPATASAEGGAQRVAAFSASVRHQLNGAPSSCSGEAIIHLAQTDCRRASTPSVCGRLETPGCIYAYLSRYHSQHLYFPRHSLCATSAAHDGPGTSLLTRNGLPGRFGAYKTRRSTAHAGDVHPAAHQWVDVGRQFIPGCHSIW